MEPQLDWEDLRDQYGKQEARLDGRDLRLGSSRDLLNVLSQGLGPTRETGQLLVCWQGGNVTTHLKVLKSLLGWNSGFGR